MRAKFVLMAIASVLTASPSKSAPYGYECSITKVVLPDNDVTTDWATETAKGSKVVIDRQTGKVVHPLLGNSGYPRTEIIHAGSAEYSFKVLTISRGGGFVKYYKVDEFAETKRKPFFATSDSTAFYGYCE